MHLDTVPQQRHFARMFGKDLLLLLRARNQEAWDHLAATVKLYDGNLRDTAEALGIGRASLYRMLEVNTPMAEAVRNLARGHGKGMTINRTGRDSRKSTVTKKKRTKGA